MGCFVGNEPIVKIGSFFFILLIPDARVGVECSGGRVLCSHLKGAGGNAQFALIKRFGVKRFGRPSLNTQG